MANEHNTLLIESCTLHVLVHVQRQRLVIHDGVAIRRPMIPNVDKMAGEILLHLTSLGEELEGLAFAEEAMKENHVTSTVCGFGPVRRLLLLDDINVHVEGSGSFVLCDWLSCCANY